MEAINSSSSTKNWTSFLTAEVLVFGLLGKALFECPDHAWLLYLAEEGVFSEFPVETETPEVAQGITLLQKWAQEYLQGHSGETYDALRDDYTRLFIGPGKVLASPWESVYLNRDRLIFQEQTLQVRNWYRRFGLEMDKLYQEPDDHIGLELIFLAHLSSLAIQAAESQDEALLMQLLTAQWEFLREHPLQWAAQWCADVVEFSRGDFYKGVAYLVKGVLDYTRNVYTDQFGEL